LRGGPSVQGERHIRAQPQYTRACWTRRQDGHFTCSDASAGIRLGFQRRRRALSWRNIFQASVLCSTAQRSKREGRCSGDVRDLAGSRFIWSIVQFMGTKTRSPLVYFKALARTELAIEVPMPRYYFHQLNGRRFKDQRGIQFANRKQACEHAVYQLPVVLKRAVRPTCNTFLAIEISDGENTLSVIRGKVTSEKY